MAKTAEDKVIELAQTTAYEVRGQKVDPITAVALKVLAVLAVVEAAAQAWMWIMR